MKISKKMSNLGVISMGIKAPIVKKGDNIKNIVLESINTMIAYDGINLSNGDVIGITESVVARTLGNYCNCDDIVKSCEKVFGERRDLILANPIMSRNRFSVILRGIARYANSIQFLYNNEDEVGNPCNIPNPFTGVDVKAYYNQICEEEHCAASELHIPYGGGVPMEENWLNCKCHVDKSQRIKWHALDEIMTESINGSGYNETYGVLGSNKAGDEVLKLFPRDCTTLCEAIKTEILNKYNVDVHVMVYADGCFHSPALMDNDGKFIPGSSIWEFADPVTSPGFTSGLEKTPNEMKLKYFADKKYGLLKGKALEDAIKQEIKDKESNLVGNMTAEGTTPRRYVDLLASLMDLTSGSGDKGTPIILVKNYFKNYTS